MGGGNQRQGAGQAARGGQGSGQGGGQGSGGDEHQGLDWLRESVPGEPGVDYPVYRCGQITWHTIIRTKHSYKFCLRQVI